MDQVRQGALGVSEAATIRAWRRAVMGDDGHPHVDGALVIQDLKAFCTSHAGLPIDSNNRSDALALAYQRGREDVYRHIVNRIYDDPRKYEER